MTEGMKVWELEELLHKEEFKEKIKKAEVYILRKELAKRKLKDAIDERGIPELHDPKANITLINHKYNPDRKLFPDEAWAKHKKRGWKPLSTSYKYLILLNGMKNNIIAISIVLMLALIDY